MSKIHIRIDSPYRQHVERPRLRQAALKTLLHEKAQGSAGLTLIITGDDEVRALNRAYRNIDAPTDVLSFGEGTAGAPFVNAPGEPAYLGDVIISYPRAQSQAQSGHHPVGDELVLLVVHGVLHLLGHDHATRREKSKMWTVQDQVLSELGVRIQISER